MNVLVCWVESWVEPRYLYATPNSLFSHNGAGRWFTRVGKAESSAGAWRCSATVRYVMHNTCTAHKCSDNHPSPHTSDNRYCWVAVRLRKSAEPSPQSVLCNLCWAAYRSTPSRRILLQIYAYAHKTSFCWGRRRCLGAKARFSYPFLPVEAPLPRPWSLREWMLHFTDKDQRRIRRIAWIIKSVPKANTNCALLRSKYRFVC